MNLNSEQEGVIAVKCNICVEACPGSGKTRTIIAKLLSCVEEVRDSPRRIACITYTHAAVDEIESRLRQYGATGDEQYYEVSTLHSFCLANILRPFHYLLPELRNGMRILPPDSEVWIRLVQELSRKHRLTSQQADSFERVQRRPDHTVFAASIGEDAAVEFLGFLDKNALVSYSDIVYHSFRLTEMAPFIARGIACRFAWMLVDEFQDTSAVQIAILNAVGRWGKTRFFLVGDPNQAIMGFAGADPHLMRSFSAQIGARRDLRLRGSYRCSARIVAHAERLIATTPPMCAVGASKDYPAEPEHIRVENVASGILEHYLPTLDYLNIPLGHAAVLAPWWVVLYRLARELSTRGVPVLGPGARPYRRSRPLATLAEHLCAYAEERSPELFRSLQRALFNTLLGITSCPDWRVFSYEGQRCLCGLTMLAREIRDSCGTSAVNWLRTGSTQFESRLLEDGFIGTEHLGTLRQSAEDMIQDMRRNSVDLLNLSVSGLALYAIPRECIHLMTMHSSKGREFDAVAIVDLHDGRVPHYSWQTTAEYDEARRLLYVAMTRARKVLMYFTDCSDPRNRPTPFLSEILGPA